MIRSPISIPKTSQFFPGECHNRGDGCRETKKQDQENVCLSRDGLWITFASCKTRAARCQSNFCIVQDMSCAMSEQLLHRARHVLRDVRTTFASCKTCPARCQNNFCIVQDMSCAMSEQLLHRARHVLRDVRTTFASCKTCQNPLQAPRKAQAGALQTRWQRAPMRICDRCGGSAIRENVPPNR